MAYEKTIMLLSGPIGSGKTTLALHMEKRYAAHRISTAAVLSAVIGRDLSRSELQQVYTHRQLPSGTRATKTTPLLIGAGAVINPNTLLKEIVECGISADRLTIDH